MRTGMLETIMVVGLLAGAFALYGSACASNAADQNRNGRNSAKGTCPAADNDGNQCTIEGCKGSAQQHIPTPGAPCGNGLTCDSIGQCAGCTAPEQCGTSDECATWSCNSGVCAAAFMAKGQATQNQVDQDCAVLQCDGLGGIETVEDALDKPGDTNCTRWMCNAGNIEEGLAQEGDSCIGQQGKVCTAGGQCVDCITSAHCTMLADGYCHQNQCFSCSSGVQDGDETGVDCGGSCKKCDGEGCTAAGDCKSTFCMDQLCCDTACEERCRACNIAGIPGVCANIPPGEKDLEGANKCSAAEACNANGTCVAKAANGDPCTAPGDCASNNCTNMVCVPP